MNRAEVVAKMRDSFNMTKQRCYNPNCRDYIYYGGRGISICQRWMDSFDNLIADMGLRPDGHTLERVDNDGDYSPDNCRWATRKEQCANTRAAKLVTHNGQTHNLSEWERILGWKAGTLKARLGVLGYSVDEAFSKEVKCGGLLPGKYYPPKRKPVFQNKATKARSLRGIDLELATFMFGRGKSFSHISRWFGVSVTTASNAVQRKGAYLDHQS